MTRTKPPSISVIVASYNYENYITETLNSLVGQTYKSFEVIIVDDGSKDNSINIIKKYTDQYENFHLFVHKNNENKGLIETVKRGLEEAKGNYISFLESDDYWAIDHLEKKANFIKNNEEAAIIINGIKTIGDKYCDDYVKKQLSILRKFGRGNFFKYFEKSNLIPTFSCVMVKKEILETANFDTFIPAWLDYWLWRQLALENKIDYLDLNLTFWRRHQLSYINTSKDSELKRKNFIKANNKILIKRNLLLFVYNSIISFFLNIFKTIDKLNKSGFYVLGLPYLSLKQKP